MGEDCDRLAARLHVSREEQDRYAVRSHLAAARATAEGVLKGEIETVLVPPDFKPIDKDNGFRGDTSLEKMGSLKPAFVKKYGTVTAGNASFLTDGAAACLLMAEEVAASLGYTPKAWVRAYAYTAQDPFEELLLGPAYATPKCLEMAGLKLQDMDVFEFHEAFAGQILGQFEMSRIGRICAGEARQIRKSRRSPSGEIQHPRRFTFPGAPLRRYGSQARHYGGQSPHSRRRYLRTGRLLRRRSHG